MLRALAATAFVVTHLVAHDPAMINAWGLAASPTGPWWIANEARDTSTLYAGDGKKQALTIHVDGGPTGVVYHGGNGFVVRADGHSGPARFIYACEDGTIRAWSPTVPNGWSKVAVPAFSEGAAGAIYRGVALAKGRLYVADFHNAKIVVLDSRWRRVKLRGAFDDPKISPWYAPFNIAAFGDRIFVTYAYRAPVDGNDAPNGGYVDEFDLNGKLVARVGTSAQLAEPWGVAVAPKGFGDLGGALLVANFGTGRINAYMSGSKGWKLRGVLPVQAPGVWGIAFGNGGMAGPKTTLFYAAGPHKWHGASEISIGGVLGAIRPASRPG